MTEVSGSSETLVNIYLVVCFLLGNSPASEFYMPTFRKTLFHLHRWIDIHHTYSPTKMEQNVPKRRHIKFRRRRITQKNIKHSEHGEIFKSGNIYLIARRHISGEGFLTSHLHRCF
jgi:hypothetical protein